ncbi:hypothetical protein V7S43_015990 [Phytophthora oleae]|uniref:Crinkler (CRN) family protein n=1 Tax=Phytophthora oleae TaxID=2107226 RepID=A0ABD3EXT6_9STRA
MLMPMLFLAKKENGKWVGEDEAEGVRESVVPQGFKQMNRGLLLKKPENFGGDFQPGEGQVHVLVAIPEGEVSHVGVANEGISNMLNFQARDEKRKRSVYSLSDLDLEKEQRIMKKMRLDVDYIDCEEQEDTYVPGYRWLDVAEDAETQWVNYMAYLEKHLKTTLEKEKLYLLDISDEREALTVVDPRLPFRMNGTADVLLVDNRSTTNREPLAGVCVAIEVKKEVEDRRKAKALGQLVSASLKAPLNCTPIQLLTDLNNHWYFYWFNEKNVLTHVSLQNSKNAMAFIAAAGADPGSSKPFSVPFIDRPLTKFKIDDFLDMPDDGVDEMMERWVLMADVLEPEFLNERRAVRTAVIAINPHVRAFV